MEKIRSNAQLIFAVSIFCLALSIAYFAYELTQFRIVFPQILTQMETTSKVIYPTVNGIAEISKNIPPIADSIDKVEKSMPSVLAEVKATRESLPGILTRIDTIMDKLDDATRSLPAVVSEVQQTREMVPGIVKEIHDTNAQIPGIVKQVDGIRKQIPQMVKTVNNASESMRMFSTELAQAQKLVPPILDEVRKTRKALPPMLDKAQKIVEQGQRFGKEASEGAVSGLILGVINPLNISSRLKALVLPGKKIPKLSDADIALIRETTIQAIESEKTGKMFQWENPTSNHYGDVTLLRKFKDNGEECREIRVEIFEDKGWFQKEKTHDFSMVLCREPGGAWTERGKTLLNQ